MGYSCSAKANYVLRELIVQLKARGQDRASSNVWEFAGYDYFYELGREQPDGAITSQVMKVVNERCHRVGGLRIENNGSITNAPTSNSAQRAAAETAGLIKFHEIHGGSWNTDEVLQKHIKGASFVVV